MIWIHAINETAASELNESVMNPMSAERIRLLGQRLRLQPNQHLLDVGAGRCGPALIFARDFGCRITAVEPYGIFLDDARHRVTAAGLSDRFRFIQKKAEDFETQPDEFDVAMCLGATWAWGDLRGTLGALAKATRPEGYVAAGEPYVMDAAQKAAASVHNLTFQEILEEFESAGLSVITAIRSTDSDWDTYHSIQARSLLDWIESNPASDEIETVRKWRMEAVLRFAEERMGWAIVAGRKNEDKVSNLPATTG